MKKTSVVISNNEKDNHPCPHKRRVLWNEINNFIIMHKSNNEIKKVTLS